MIQYTYLAMLYHIILHIWLFNYVRKGQWLDAYGKGRTHTVYCAHCYYTQMCVFMGFGLTVGPFFRVIQMQWHKSVFFFLLPLYNLCYPCFLTHGDHRLFIRLMFTEFKGNGFFLKFFCTYHVFELLFMHFSDEHLCVIDFHFWKLKLNNVIFILLLRFEFIAIL